MTTDLPNKLRLMGMHVEALFAHDAFHRITHVNVPGGKLAPRIFIGRTSEGIVRRYRDDVPDDLVAALESLCTAESLFIAKNLSDTPTKLPDYVDDYVALLDAHTPITQIWSGPAWWLSPDAGTDKQSLGITPDNADLLRGSMDDWVGDVPDMQPMKAIIEDGKAVSLCATVRITDKACEPGGRNHRGLSRQGVRSSRRGRLGKIGPCDGEDPSVQHQLG